MSKLQTSLVYESINKDWDAVLSREYAISDSGTLELLGIASPGLGAPYVQATYRQRMVVGGNWAPCTLRLDGRVDSYNRVSTRVSVRKEWSLPGGEVFAIHALQSASHSKLRYRNAVVRAGVMKEVPLKGENAHMPPVKLALACDTKGRCVGVVKQGRVQLSTDWHGNWTAKLAVREDPDARDEWI
eukprot:ctg_254.g107